MLIAHDLCLSMNTQICESGQIQQDWTHRTWHFSSMKSSYISCGIVSIVLLASSLAAQAPCPCKDPNFCKPPQIDPKRTEVFAFALSNDENNWQRYDWSKLTTLVKFGGISDSLICLAHSKGVRLVAQAGMGLDFTNATARQEMIKGFLATAKGRFIDGFNFDYESLIAANDSLHRDAYTAMVRETRQTLKKELPHIQISVDVAWKQNVDARFYDYAGLADASDFLFIMAYDEQSQIFGECLAGPNSGIDRAAEGIQDYMKAGISASKLVLGVPWYGYIYPCLKLEQDKCHIKPVPFRGVYCSDAAGRQYDYSFVVTLKATMPHDYHWNATAASPYITYKDFVENVAYQVQYDNPQSLSLKYQMAASFKLRGVGMWNIDSLDYTDTAQGMAVRKEMFGALPSQ